jgi:CubicO group peptidase (beta-lactamase class C family)
MRRHDQHRHCWLRLPGLLDSGSVTAAVALRLADDRLLALNEPLADQLAPTLPHRRSALGALPGRLQEMTRWPPGASFPPGHTVRYDRYGLGMGAITVSGVELLGHTGFIGAFAFHAPDQDAVLVGTHNDSEVDRWPLVTTLCRELGDAA